MLSDINCGNLPLQIIDIFAKALFRFEKRYPRLLVHNGVLELKDFVLKGFLFRGAFIL